MNISPRVCLNLGCNGSCTRCDPDWEAKLEHHRRWAEEYHKWKRPGNLITLKEFDHD